MRHGADKLSGTQCNTGRASRAMDAFVSPILTTMRAIVARWLRSWSWLIGDPSGPESVGGLYSRWCIGGGGMGISWLGFLGPACVVGARRLGAKRDTGEWGHPFRCEMDPPVRAFCVAKDHGRSPLCVAPHTLSLLPGLRAQKLVHLPQNDRRRRGF